jgi:hypothetical protein
MCILGFLSTLMKEYITLLFSYILHHKATPFQNLEECGKPNLFPFHFQVVILVDFLQDNKKSSSKKKTLVFFLFISFVIYWSLFFIFIFKESFFAFLLPSCFINVSNMGASRQGFISIMLHTLHLTL